ncbi:MAG: helix-turn-helix domain-containing protein [Bacteroidales bacterium]|jgi:excisionase family DNA binding protein|nr:helix-turn-helix domain-containing protein [Bacteroidales bacterium]
MTLQQENILGLKKILTLEELCNYTSLSKSTIYKKTSLGEIPHFKKAKHLFFIREQIENWLTSEPGFDRQKTEREATNYVVFK